uniref:Putative GT2: distantly related to GDP-Man: Dol-P b-mannosyltransferase n=1 Tax=Magnetococcus massalia (strain MO-1) TaxID=451514 RepID=A0A1S7LDT9_MAGMO|nr:putative GT2 : distantly related to GDP-Man: Dol-P b-mannosyltransferase [Candidatus Magnetococcus massalia]
MFNLLIAVPCYNEAAELGAVLHRMPTALDGVDQITLLVIDDGSTDTTSEVARQHGAEVIRHHRNMGLGIAFQNILKAALEKDVDAVVTMDGDGQFNPDDIPTLLGTLRDEKAAMVTASRFMDPAFLPTNIPPAKLKGNRMMSWLINRLCGASFHDVSCGFRAYSREAILHLNLHGRFTYTQEVFLDIQAKRLKIVEVPVQVIYKAGRRSRMAHSLLRYGFQTLLIILRSYRDYQPLRFFLWIALFFYLLAIGFGANLLIHFFETGKFYGEIWSGMVSGVMLMLGVATTLMGLLSDMMVRIRENQERVLYLLKRNGHTDRSESSSSV